MSGVAVPPCEGTWQPLADALVTLKRDPPLLGCPRPRSRRLTELALGDWGEGPTYADGSDVPLRVEHPRLQVCGHQDGPGACTVGPQSRGQPTGDTGDLAQRGGRTTGRSATQWTVTAVSRQPAAVSRGSRDNRGARSLPSSK